MYIIHTFTGYEVVIRIRKPKKDIQDTGKVKKVKGSNNDLLNTMHRKLMNPTKILCKCSCSGRVNSYCSISDTCRADPVTNPVISHE